MRLRMRLGPSGVRRRYAADLLLFRCSRCPAQAGCARVRGCLRLCQGADGCRRCRYGLPSEIAADLPPPRRLGGPWPFKIMVRSNMSYGAQALRASLRGSRMTLVLRPAPRTLHMIFTSSSHRLHAASSPASFGRIRHNMISN